MYEMPSWKLELQRRLAAIRKRPAPEGRATPAAAKAAEEGQGPRRGRRSAPPFAGK